MLSKNCLILPKLTKRLKKLKLEPVNFKGRKPMREKISRLLSEIEAVHNIKILFAVENGSRAWGMESKDSDYDVRFVFYRPVADYLSMTKPAEVIISAYDKDLNPHEVKGSLIDMSGFDIFKYLKLLYSSNPTTIEWLESPIVYIGNNNIGLKRYVEENFNQKRLFFHYFSLFQNSYKSDIQNNGKITYKKYLYAMRGLLNAKYVQIFNKIPPLNITDAVDALDETLPAGVAGKFREIIDLKRQGLEKDHILNIPVFDAFFRSEAATLHDIPNQKSMDVAVFNDFLKDCLKIG